MSEVSGRVTAMLVDGMDRHGLDVTTTFAGLPVTRAQLVDINARLPWDTFVTMLERVEALSTKRALTLDALVTSNERMGHPFVGIARSLAGPASGYRLIARWGLPRDVSVVRASFERLGRSFAGILRGRLVVSIDHHHVGSVPFFKLLAGLVRSLPGVVGLSPGEMTYHATSHEAVYEMDLPEPRTLVERSRRAALVIAGASTTLDALEAQANEIRAKNVQLEQTLAEHRRVEKTLREREAWLELALEAGRIGLWSWDIRTDRLSWSPSLPIFRDSDKSAPPTLARYLERVHVEDRADVARETHSSDDVESEHRIVRDDGSVGWIRMRGKVVRDDRGSPISATGTVVDVSEQKALEMQLLFADRMASVGKLAAGVAHELNNPLGYVIANVALMRKHLAQLGPHREVFQPLLDAVNAVDEGSGRMREIMTNLRAFSRPEDQRRSAIDLRRIIDASIRLVANEIRHRAELITEYEPGLPLIFANEARLGQVFINLLVNAAHAIPESPSARGIIRVRTYQEPSGHVVVSVEDNGTGMTSEVRRRLFEPFFTTKEIGKGMGLGLAVCENIISSLGGSIEVDSEVQSGTTFRVLLPPAPPREQTSELDPGSDSSPSTLPSANPRPASAIITNGKAVVHEEHFATGTNGLPVGLQMGESVTSKNATRGALRLEEREPPSASKARKVTTLSSRKTDTVGVTGGRILVIDDEPSFRTTLKMLLDSHGFEVTIADTAKAGLSLALERGFDVILCDLMMPGMTGMDLHAELVRARPDIAKRLIFLTGGAFTPRASMFLDRVDSPHVEKPFDLQHLLATIEIAKTRSLEQS